MSIHVPLNDEAKRQLEKQKRVSTISSFLISILTIVLVALLLGFFLINTVGKEEVQIVTYQANAPDETEPEAEKVKTNVQRKPTAPSSSPVKTIVATTTSATSIPTVDAVEAVEALDFGEGDDFGAGVGFGDGVGFGGGGGTSFFNQKVKASRIVYVIDYSASMGQLGRNQLMRDELTKSVRSLSPGSSYQLVFFAGPYWVGGDEVIKVETRDKNDEKVQDITIKAQDGKTYKWGDEPFAKTYKQEPKVPDWKPASEANIKESLIAIKETPLILGTKWQGPLEFAMEMKPTPELIFFMTDGLTSGNIIEITDELAKTAKRKNITINTVSLIEPRAEEAMLNLAKKTGGVATLVDKDGKAKEIKK